jgi:hypothetical protein
MSSILAAIISHLATRLLVPLPAANESLPRMDASGAIAAVPHVARQSAYVNAPLHLGPK